MSSSKDSILRMANDIARNFAQHGEAAAANAVAEHIQLFWDPRMKMIAFSILDEPEYDFSNIARLALSQLSAKTANHAK